MPANPRAPGLHGLLAALRRDASVSAVIAGLVAVLVGFTSSVAIVFQAAQSLGATAAQTASWMWALGIGMGLCSLLPSLWLRQPVLAAWSTPGAAVIATAATAGAFTLGEAVGAFVVCGVLITLAGVTRAFERVMNRIPMALAQALLAGVLARFALDAVLAVGSAPLLVLAMAATYLVARRTVPRYAVPWVLLVGCAVAAAEGRIEFGRLQGSWATPVFVAPEWSLAALVGLALPLFIVTMASQNLPGVAAIRASGFGDKIPVSPVIAMTGVASVVLAPFGGYALNLAAITAAICMGPEAHEEPSRRWVAPVAAGVLYVVIGVFGAAVAGLLATLPRELVLVIAGLALLGTIGGALGAALGAEPQREAALVTFLVTLSGVAVAPRCCLCNSGAAAERKPRFRPHFRRPGLHRWSCHAPALRRRPA
jgi:benzoate membrane transport protein